MASRGVQFQDKNLEEAFKDTVSRLNTTEEALIELAVGYYLRERLHITWWVPTFIKRMGK